MTQIDWLQYLDPDFNDPKDVYKTRDYVITRCSNCRCNSKVQVNNLKRQIKRLGTHICWGCSCQRGALRRHGHGG